MKRRIVNRLYLFFLITIVGCSGNEDTTASSGAGGTAEGPSAGISGSGDEIGVSGSSAAGITSDQAGSAGTAEAGTDVEVDGCKGLTTETDDDGNPLINVLDAHNYTFKASIAIQTTRVKSLSDLVFDWSEVTKDLRRRDLDPLSSIDQLRVVAFHTVTEDEFMQLISTEGDIVGHVVGLILTDTNNSITSTNLLDLHPPAGDEYPDEKILEYVDTDLYPPESHVYAAILAEGDNVAGGFLMLNFFRPDPDETNTLVKFTDSSTQLDYTVDLTSLQKIVLPAGVNNITFKWTDKTLLSTTATGNDFRPQEVSDVMIGHYPDMTPGDLENQFLNIDGIAERIWTKFLSEGTTISLADLQNESGESFPGIDGQGTWVFALLCGSCTSPAPLFLNILEVCPE